MPSPPNQAIYIGKIRNVRGTLAAANVNRDGSGSNFNDLFVADANNGSRAIKVTIMHAGPIGVAPTVATNIIRAWIKNGGAYKLLQEFAITPATPTATVAGTISVNILNQDLAAGDTLAFTQHTNGGTSDNFDITVTGGDYSPS